MLGFQRKTLRIFLLSASVFLLALMTTLDSLGERLSQRQSRQRAEALEIVSANSQTFYGPSLEMRENVDFLLTPAMLVQEAIDPQVVITYPNE